MTVGRGQELQALLTSTVAEGWQVRSGATGAASEWQLAGETWRARIVIDPARWIGLEFAATMPGTTRTADYALDTDLYRIDHPDEQAFAYAIEQQIVVFLRHLKGGRVRRLVGPEHYGLIIPEDDAHVRIDVGRFLTTSTRGVGPVPDDAGEPVV